MKRTIFLAVVAALLLAAVGAGGWIYLSSQAPAGSAASQQAAQQFFAERGNGGTPGPITNTMTFGGNSADGTGHPPGVAGAIAQVLSDTLVVQNPMDSTTTTVHLAADTKITRQADMQLADLKPGTHITAAGTKQGDTLEAQHVQVGDDSTTAGGGAPVQMAVNPSGGDGAAPSTSMMITSVSGTIAQVNGNAITVQSDDGQTTTVQLAANGQIQHQVPIGPADIHIGDLIFATGTQQGAVFEATQVQVGAGGMMQVVCAPPP
jgi:hypothetical protein